MWHDQALFKEPRRARRRRGTRTRDYWPHKREADQISIWIALKDATIPNGCMSFVPGSHKVGGWSTSAWPTRRTCSTSPRRVPRRKPVTCELPAGSCTFHNGLTFHYAGPNKSDGMREAFAIIYMPDGTHYDGEEHIVTDPLGLKVGDELDGRDVPVGGVKTANERQRLAVDRTCFPSARTAGHLDSRPQELEPEEERVDRQDAEHEDRPPDPVVPPAAVFRLQLRRELRVARAPDDAVDLLRRRRLR